MRLPSSPLSVSVVLLTLAATAFAADDAPAVEGDLKGLQGSWQTKLGPEKDVPLVVAIKGDAVTATFTGAGGESVVLKGKIRLDEKASPRTIDWVEFNRPDGAPAEKNQGIYELKGDTWRVCNGGPGNSRPTEFAGGFGDRPTLIVFERVKDEPKTKD
jgi:uncharacterized protein (TIGR03067 family)